MQGHSEGEIWGLAAHPEEEIFVTGSDDGTVCVWDVSAKVNVCSPRHGFACHQASKID